MMCVPLILKFIGIITHLFRALESFDSFCPKLLLLRMLHIKYLAPMGQALSTRWRLRFRFWRELPPSGSGTLGGGPMRRPPTRLPAGTRARVSRRTRGLYLRLRMDARKWTLRSCTRHGNVHRWRLGRGRPDTGDAARAPRPPPTAPERRHSDVGLY